MFRDDPRDHVWQGYSSEKNQVLDLGFEVLKLGFEDSAGLARGSTGRVQDWVYHSNQRVDGVLGRSGFVLILFWDLIKVVL